MTIAEDKALFADIPKRCLAVRTAMTARMISRLYDHALRDTGITNTQFSLLIATGAGDFPSMAALGDLLCIDRSTLSRNFKPLFEAGYVERELGQKGRAIPLRLTSKGREKLEEAIPKWEAAQARIEQQFSRNSLSSGKAFLRALRKAAEVG
jgi:DNA-binding MarR family transcriptional regulator